MKESKLMISLTVLFLVMISAFVGKAAFRANTYYYISGATCLPITIDYSCNEGSPSNCIEPGYGLLHQNRSAIPGTNPVRYTCETPLTRQ